MKAVFEVTEKELRELVAAHLRDKLGSFFLESTDVKILVKSKQNWKSEWEEADFKATITVES